MKQLLIFSIFILSTIISKAQQGGERVEAMRIAFITQKLNLTPEEAQKFWPVFNEFSDQMKTLRRQKKQALEAIRNDNVSESDLQKANKASFDIEQQELELKRKYMNEFSKVLPAKKVALLMDAEREFKQKMVDKMQERKAGVRQQRGMQMRGR